MEEQKKTNWRGFWKVYFVILLLLALFWAALIFRVYNLLEGYEQSQPKYLMNHIVEVVKSGEVDRYLNFEEYATKFESKEMCREVFREYLENKEITYRLLSENVGNYSQTYGLYADDVKIADVILGEYNVRTILSFFSIGDWTMESAFFDYPEERNAVQISVPSIYTVTVNGVELTEKEYLSQPEKMTQFQYVEEYTTNVPKMVTYRVEGFMDKPNIQVLDLDGRAIDIKETWDNGEALLTMNDFVTEDMDSDLMQMALDNAIRYSNYFTRDLEGARKSVEPIADMFPEGSYFLEIADQYRRRDMWMFNSHKTPVFSNEQVNNYVRYSDELFSCEVSFQKEMLLTQTRTIRRDSSNTKFFYGLMDGEWKIFDIISLVSETIEE